MSESCILSPFPLRPQNILVVIFKKCRPQIQRCLQPGGGGVSAIDSAIANAINGAAFADSGADATNLNGAAKALSSAVATAINGDATVSALCWPWWLLCMWIKMHVVQCCCWLLLAVAWLRQ